MLDFTIDNLTDVVVEACQENASSPRVKQIMGNLEFTHAVRILRFAGSRRDDGYDSLEQLP